MLSRPEVTEVSPDRDARIRSEDVWRETDIAELTTDITHCSEGDEPVAFSLARVAKNEIEGDAYAGQVCLASGFVHLIDALMAFVHHLQHGLRGGFCAEPHIGDATVGK